jgi:dienelactone hydrolase
MIEETIRYQDGNAELVGTFFSEGDAPRPTILVFPAFEGLSKFVFDYAKRLLPLGFNCFIADMYGDAIEETTIMGCFEQITPFLQDRSLVRRRAELAYHTASHLTQVDKHKIGAIGFCFGGMCVLELARSGVDLKAGVSAHGVLGAAENLTSQPVKGELLILHGYQDPQVPPTVLNDFAKEMAGLGNNNWTFTFFGGAKHAFTDPATGSMDPEKEQEMGREYNQYAAEKTFSNAVDFF